MIKHEINWMSDDGSGGVVKSYEYKLVWLVIIGLWMKREKWKQKLFPPPQGWIFQKKKKKDQKPMINKQINAIYSSFLSPTPPDHHPPLFNYPSLCLCVASEVISIWLLLIGLVVFKKLTQLFLFDLPSPVETMIW